MGRMSAVDWCFFLPLFFFSWYSIFLCMELLAVASGIELLAAASGRDEFSSCPTVSLLSTCIVPSGPGPHRHGGSAAAEAAPGAHTWATASADDYRKSGWYKPWASLKSLVQSGFFERNASTLKRSAAHHRLCSQCHQTPVLLSLWFFICRSHDLSGNVIAPRASTRNENAIYVVMYIGLCFEPFIAILRALFSCLPLSPVELSSGRLFSHIEHLLPMNNNFHISYVCFVNGRVRSPSRRHNEQVLAPTHRRMMPTDRSASTRGEQ